MSQSVEMRAEIQAFITAALTYKKNVSELRYAAVLIDGAVRGSELTLVSG